jgi:hypothetical protein
MPRDLQPTFLERRKPEPLARPGFQKCGVIQQPSTSFGMKENAKKLLQALVLGVAGGIGKVVGAALATYLLAQLVSWFLR